jgi:hypothetical protein
MFLITPRHRSAKELRPGLRPGLNSRIVLRELAALNKERLIPAKRKRLPPKRNM